MMDSSAAAERGRGRRLLVVLAVLLGLLVAVAIASTGDTPIGGTGLRRPSDRLYDTVVSLFLVLIVLGIPLFVFLLLMRRRALDELKRLETPQARRTRVIGSVVAGVILVLLAVGIVTARDDDNGIGLRPPGAQTSASGREERADRYDPEFAVWPVVIVSAAVGVALLAAYASHRARRRRLGTGEQPLALALADLLEETLDDLRAERDPRAAVIAAYARLEQTLAAYGLPRQAAEAPEEYLKRIFGDLGVASRPVERLTGLFSRAKFSQHAVPASMKDEAIEALESVRVELRAAEARAAAERAAAVAVARERAATS
jgi:hypothetical protein